MDSFSSTSSETNGCSFRSMCKQVEGHVLSLSGMDSKDGQRTPPAQPGSLSIIMSHFVAAYSASLFDVVEMWSTCPFHKLLAAS